MATVLIVDDDPKLLKMLRRTLAYEGFRVLSATNGNEALAEVQAHRPDVIVLDWLMPGLDGIGVLERLRAAGDKTLVLMLTARDAVENRVEGLESGADDYLVKPFAPAELLARIHALLRRPAVASQRRSAGAMPTCRLDPVTRETRRGERAFDLTRQGVRSAALPAAPPAPGAAPRADPAGSVGLRLRRRRQRAGSLHRLPAQEDRGRRRAAPDPDRARRGLRAARGA